MPEIMDTGKIWVKGSVGPVHGVRIDKIIYATGKNENESCELWIKNKGLCIDLHNSGASQRTARFIPLNAKPTLPGTLFNGFEKTKHADVLIVASDGNYAKEVTVSGIKYQEGGFRALDPQTFWLTVWKTEYYEEH